MKQGNGIFKETLWKVKPTHGTFICIQKPSQILPKTILISNAAVSEGLFNQKFFFSF